MLKYEGDDLTKKPQMPFQTNFTSEAVLTEWKSSITILLFKRRDSKKQPKRCRGITLLSAVLTFLTKIVSHNTCEEQQGFCRNRSTTDAIFIVRHLICRIQ